MDVSCNFHFNTTLRANENEELHLNQTYKYINYFTITCIILQIFIKSEYIFIFN